VGSLGCSPGATISRVSLSLLVNVLYIVDLSLFLMFSYLKGVSTAVPAPASADRDVPKDHQSLLTTLIIVGIAFDIITSLLWINIWRRTEVRCSFCFLAITCIPLLYGTFLVHG
jgi:hypothetical protein